MTFKVTGMEIKKGTPNSKGNRIMAYFSAHNADLGFKGCALVKAPDGRWKVWTPMIADLSAADRRNRDIGVYWRAGSTMEVEILDSALKLYRLLSDDEPEAVNDNDREGLDRFLAVEDSLAMAGLD